MPCTSLFFTVTGHRQAHHKVSSTLAELMFIVFIPEYTCAEVCSLLTQQYGHHKQNKENELQLIRAFCRIQVDQSVVLRGSDSGHKALCVPCAMKANGEGLGWGGGGLARGKAQVFLGTIIMRQSVGRVTRRSTGPTRPLSGDGWIAASRGRQ